MTEKDKEIQELRRRISALEKANIVILVEYDKAMAANTKLKAERDAAVADLRKCAFENDCECYYCKQYHEIGKCGGCDLKANNWEWRGVQDDKL